MARTKYQATHNGQTFTRTSPRIYTHMVAARPSYDYALRQAKARGHADQDARNYRYYLARSQGLAGFQPGTIAEVEGYKFRSEDGLDLEAYVEAEKARGLEALGGAVSVEDYQRLQTLKRLEKVELSRAHGHFDRFMDCGWAGRPDLAQKNAAKHGAPFWAETVVLQATVKGAK
jgi:hypothetical protein